MATSAPWKICQACGSWQRSGGGPCGTCQWPRLSPASTGRDLSELRVLVDVELRSDRGWRVLEVVTPRIGGAIDWVTVLQRLNGDGLRALLGEREKAASFFPPWASWDRFRELARSLIDDEVNGLIRRSWDGLRKPSPARVVVSIRATMLDPDVTPPKPSTAPAWFVVVPFHAAAASAAASLSDDDVEFDLSRARVGFAEGEDRIEVAVRASREMVIRDCKVVSGGCEILSAPVERIVRREVLTQLPSIVLSADAVRSCVQTDVPSAELHFSVRGTEKVFVSPIPIEHLPVTSAVADIFLDLGSTTTKWALRVDGNDPVERDQDTDTLTKSWGIAAYRKADLLADVTGGRWSDWVARALPALRRWVGSEHNAFLRNVYLALPSTGQFDTDAVARSLGATVEAGDARSPSGTLNSATTQHLVSGGRVVLRPEDQYLAAHYRSVLAILQRAARAYASRFTNAEARRTDQAKRLKAWDASEKAVKDYDSKWFVYRWFNERPMAPSGTRPSVDAKITNPAEWMNDLVDHPEQFDRLVVLDAGGLSLDISVIEMNVPVRSRCRSDTACGGEAISARVGRREVGARGTRYKARLGLQWLPERDLSAAEQREYRDATRQLYGPVLSSLFGDLGGSRWKQSPYSCVLLTGGGARNPHLAEYVSELAAAGLRATVIDAPTVMNLIAQARDFPEPLPDINSNEIRRFETTQAWSARRERQERVRYDKFAVVGGMWAQASGLRL